MSPELIHYSLEFTIFNCTITALCNELIKRKAEFQSLTSQLFRLCVLKFYKDVVFLQDRSEIYSRVDNETYCEGVYTIVNDDEITFYDSDDTPILRLPLLSDYEEVEVVN